MKINMLTDGSTSTGGLNGGPAHFAKQYVYVTWAWPSNMVNPTAFDVAIYTGTDPTATDLYLSPIQRCEGADRHIQFTTVPTASISNINASVRAVYV
jgi:hypothetical protein